MMVGPPSPQAILRRARISRARRPSGDATLPPTMAEIYAQRYVMSSQVGIVIDFFNPGAGSASWFCRTGSYGAASMRNTIRQSEPHMDDAMMEAYPDNATPW